METQIESNIRTRLAVFAVLAVSGLVLTMYQNILFMIEHEGFSLSLYIAENYVNHASASITNDVLVASTVFLVWLYIDSKRLEIRFWWVFVILNYFVSFAFAFPAYLIVRELRIKRALPA